LSFRSIPVEKKIEAVYRIIKGKNIQPVAREAGVDRSSVYLWRERALASLKEALEPHKRGPKFKKDPKDKEIEKLKEKLEPPKKKERLPKCPYCGFEKVYKNGSYKRKLKGSLID